MNRYTIKAEKQKKQFSICDKNGNLVGFLFVENGETRFAGSGVIKQVEIKKETGENKVF